AGDKWLFWVVRNGVLVDRDVSLAQCFFSHFTGDALGTQVHQHDVAFGATGHDAQTALDQGACQHVSVFHNLSRVGLEFRSQGFLECNSLTSDHVDQWAALNAGENSRVDGFFVFGLHHDDATTRTAQRLVSGRRHKVSVRHGVGIGTTRNQTSVVGNIHHQQGAVFVSDTCHAFKVDAQGVSRSTTHDQLGLVLFSQALQFVIVQLFVLVQTVGHEVVQLARGVHGGTVGQVTAFSQAHAQNGITGVEHSHVHTLVGLRTRVRLQVGYFSAELLLQAVNSQLLDHVHELATAVVALARITFRVFVGQLCALGLHHGGAGVVFRGDQLDVLLLAHIFALNRSPKIGVNFVKSRRTVKHEGS